MKRLFMLLGHLESFQAKVEAKIEVMNKEIQEVVSFPCRVEIVPGDGVCLLNTDSDNLAPINPAFDIIDKKGILTEEDFLQISI